MNAEGRNGIGSVGNIIAIIGFVVVVAIGLWGAVSAVRLAPKMFAVISDSFKDESPIALESSEPKVRSGDPLTLAWQDAKRDSGLYTISYNCVDGVEIQAPVSDTAFGIIPCAMPYAVAATDSSLKLIPLLHGKTEATIPIAIEYLSRDGSKIATGTTTVSVYTSTSATPVGTTPTTVKKPVATKTAVVSPATKPAPRPAPAPKPAGKPDLEVRFLGIGTTDPYTGAFMQRTSFAPHEVVSFKFDVINIGTARSGAWGFTAELPTNPPYHYDSPTQSSLNRGDHVEFTLTFSMPQYGNATVSVDPYNAVREISEGNNTLTSPTVSAY
ncbi:MAG: CARDB domain-containing protein [Patescibacteria group bacterium]